MLNNFQSFFLIFIIFFIIFIGNYLFITYFSYKENAKHNTKKINTKHNTKKINIKEEFINNSMGSILILFGTLKLYDLNKFSDIFLKYNLVSQKFLIYSYIYPFIEIILGIFLFFRYKIRIIYIFISILMIISLISVSISLYQGKNLRCGCLGSFFHIPLSYVTISENIIMLFMVLNNLSI